MEQPHASHGCSRLADPPGDVQVTIIRAPLDRVGRPRVGGLAVPTRAVITLVLLIAAVAAVLSTTRDGHVSRGRATAAAQLAAGSTIRSPAVAAVYRYPLGCLGASLATDAPASDTASRDGPCWRYGVFLTAILRQIHGVWRLGLEAVSRRCPDISLPAAVRLQLVACRR